MVVVSLLVLTGGVMAVVSLVVQYLLWCHGSGESTSNYWWCHGTGESTSTYWFCDGSGASSSTVLTGGVMQRLIGPHGVLLKVRPDVQVPVVPAKLDPGFEPWRWRALPRDVCWQGEKGRYSGGKQ